MDTLFQDVFSEYTVTSVGFKVSGESTYTLVDGAGQASESYERKVVTKAKSNVVVKRISRSAGTGELTLQLHMPMDLYNKLQGMKKGSAGNLITAVSGYGSKAKAPDCEISMQVEDEDGDKKFKYFPSAKSSEFSRSVTSEEDTVAEVSMTFSLSADAYHQIMYEALGTELDTAAGAVTSANWMTTVSSAVLQASGTTGTTGTTGSSGAAG